MAQQYQADLAVAEARSYIGVKWRHRARSRFSIDCLGLVVAAVQAGGVAMRDRVDYGRSPWKDGLEREFREHFGDPIPFEDAMPGDIALLCWDSRQGVPAHVGVLSDGKHGLQIIHSYSCSAVAEHGIDDKWRARILMVFRP
mgnify:CR=1 FL=1